MAQTAYGPVRVKVTGETTHLIAGIGGGSGTSTVITLPIPAGAVITGVQCGSCTSATGAYCATISGATFTVTTASNDLFWYNAHVKGGI
jgi:hypothetical protein